MNDLKRVWKNIRKCYRGEREIVQNDAFGWKVSSRQFDEIMRFIVDNTHQENDYVISIITEYSQRNDEENDVEEETVVESVGWRSLNPVK